MFSNATATSVSGDLLRWPRDELSTFIALPVNQGMVSVLRLKCHRSTVNWTAIGRVSLSPSQLTVRSAGV